MVVARSRSLTCERIRLKPRSTTEKIIPDSGKTETFAHSLQNAEIGVILD